MDDELEPGGRGRVSQSTRYTDVFNRVFPDYLAMGMSYDEFWNKDAALVKAYRKAYERRRDEQNFIAWNQGRYVYTAIAALAPILRTSLSKKPVKAEPYLDKPYPLTEEQAEQERLAKQKAKIESIIARMRVESEENKRKKEAKENGGQHD